MKAFDDEPRVRAVPLYKVGKKAVKLIGCLCGSEFVLSLLVGNFLFPGGCVKVLCFVRYGILLLHGFCNHILFSSATCNVILNTCKAIL